MKKIILLTWWFILLIKDSTVTIGPFDTAEECLNIANFTKKRYENHYGAPSPCWEYRGKVEAEREK